MLQVGVLCSTSRTGPRTSGALSILRGASPQRYREQHRGLKASAGMDQRRHLSADSRPVQHERDQPNLASDSSGANAATAMIAPARPSANAQEPYLAVGGFGGRAEPVDSPGPGAKNKPCHDTCKQEAHSQDMG